MHAQTSMGSNRGASVTLSTWPLRQGWVSLQAMHFGWLSFGWYWPTGQSGHTLAPFAVWFWPALQLEHTALPSVLLKRPGTQVLHDVAPWL